MTGQILRNRGAILVIFFEFFERFGYFAVLSLIALFITGAPAQGGLGRGLAEASEVVGIYVGLMFACPVLGGLLADRVLGHFRAIHLGGSLLVVGHLVLIIAALSAAGVVVPHLAYVLLWSGLSLLVAGTSLLKSTLVVVLGDTFEPDDQGRPSAYGYYFMGINLSGLVAGIGAGYLAKEFGWAQAFSMSAVVMAAATILFVIAEPYCLADAKGRRIAAVQEDAMPAAQVRPRLILLAALALIVGVFSLMVNQLWGTWLVALERDINRDAFGFEIPPQWFTSALALALVVATPLLDRFWRALEARGRRMELVMRYALGMGLAALGCAIFAGALSIGQGQFAWQLAALAVMVIAVSEVIVWAATYNALYVVLPASMTSLGVGGFYALSLGLGGYLAGLIGRQAAVVGQFEFATLLTVGGLIAAVLTAMCRPLFTRLARQASIAMP